jgi:hypothetical protein
LIDLSVQCLNGEGCVLKLSRSCTGLEVYRKVSARLPPKKGGKLKLHHLDSPVTLHQTLQEQGIVGEAAALSCTYVPTDFYAASCAVQELPFSKGDLPIEGVTRIEGTATNGPLRHIIQSLEHLRLGDAFVGSLDRVTLPSGLHTLKFGRKFNQSLKQVTLPSNLQILNFGWEFNQSLEHVTLPSNLQTLTFGHHFNQSLNSVNLPSSLQALTFGSRFNQSLEHVILPSSLQTLTFGHYFNQSLNSVTLPSNLQTLTFGHYFNQSLNSVCLPSSLRTLTFSNYYAHQRLEDVTLPSALDNLMCCSVLVSKA